MEPQPLILRTVKFVSKIDKTKFYRFVGCQISIDRHINTDNALKHQFSLHLHAFFNVSSLILSLEFIFLVEMFLRGQAAISYVYFVLNLVYRN